MFNITNDTLRYLIAGALILHGLGHSGGPWFFGPSWLIPGVDGGAIRWVFIGLWLVAMVGFLGAGLEILGVGLLPPWWRRLAVVAAVISLPVAVLFLGGTAAPNKVACVVVDAAVLVALLWAHWPSADVVGW